MTGGWLDRMILEVFAILGDSMILNRSILCLAHYPCVMFAESWKKFTGSQQLYTQWLMKNENAKYSYELNVDFFFSSSF